MMRFYTQQHRFEAGIDLHARTMHVCILDQAGAVVFDKDLCQRLGRPVPWLPRANYRANILAISALDTKRAIPASR